jgi:uncharacterized membrane protein
MNDGRRRLAAISGIVVVVAVSAYGILSVIPGLVPSRADQDPTRVTSVLQQTIATNGIEAAAAQYRTLRAEGFPGLHESESDTNRLGYVLLRTDPAAAVAVLELNAETHPRSANVYDSLGEAYLAAGNRPRAIENYRRAIAIDPTMKTALSALETLTDFRRPPYRPLVIFHIIAGMIGITTGAAAMALRKGSRRHSLAGTVFAVSMMSMSGSAAYMASVDPMGKSINIMMGVLTFYLVATAWLTARRRRVQTGVVDWAALLVAVALALSLANFGFAAAASESGSRDGSPAGVYFAFAAVASLAAVLDLRMLVRGGVSGAARLTRHLWRMSAALFIGVGSFFLGQQQFFPAAVRNTGVLAVPTLLVLAALGFFLLRVNVFNKRLTYHTSNSRPISAS